MAEKIYQMVDDNVILDWRKLNESNILTSTELTILYTLMDKIEAMQGGKVV